MSFLRRLLGRSRGSGTAEAPPTSPGQRVNLVDDGLPAPLPAPANLGISGTPEAMPWTAARLERIVRRANANPGDAQLLLEARHARHCLSSFWLRAPIDQLETLYAGPIGSVQRLLLLGALPGQPLADDEEAWRQSLSQTLIASFDSPQRLPLLLAVMPYCQPGGLQVKNAAETLPAWLLGDSASCFDPALAEQIGRPVGLLDQPTGPALSPEPSPPAVAPLPKISQLGGEEAFEMIQRQEVLERMSGLINLYSVDGDDPEVRSELAGLRRAIGQIWLDVTPAQVEQLYRSTNLGPLYRALLASNFGGLELEAGELEERNALLAVALVPDHPACLQAMLAVMPYIPQGKMELGERRDLLPEWFQREFDGLAGR